MSLQCGLVVVAALIAAGSQFHMFLGKFLVWNEAQKVRYAVQPSALFVI